MIIMMHNYDGNDDDDDENYDGDDDEDGDDYDIYLWSRKHVRHQQGGSSTCTAKR